MSEEDDELSVGTPPGDPVELILLPVEGGPAVDASVLANRKIAKDFPTTLPNALWGGLNSPEPRDSYNMLRSLLVAMDAVPPQTFVSKLMELMKYGPRDGAAGVYFKDPNRTSLASDYVYSLVKASKRLVRRGGRPLSLVRPPGKILRCCFRSPSRRPSNPPAGDWRTDCIWRRKEPSWWRSC